MRLGGRGWDGCAGAAYAYASVVRAVDEAVANGDRGGHLDVAGKLCFDRNAMAARAKPELARHGAAAYVADDDTIEGSADPFEHHAGVVTAFDQATRDAEPAAGAHPAVVYEAPRRDPDPTPKRVALGQLCNVTDVAVTHGQLVAASADPGTGGVVHQRALDE